jgi:ribosome biogenesis SPOUT family RNA methylase Rps3
LTDKYAIVPLEKIPYVDTPELRINEYESTEMPFRYVINSEGKPIMPEVREDHMDCLQDGY